MKNIILLILVFANCAHMNGQWIEQNSGTTENLNNLDFTSESIGYVVGDNGVLLKTINSGNDWNLMDSGTSESLISVCFVNENIGFIGGESGYLAKTIDGGETWESLTLNLSTSIEIYFIDSEIGFIGTDNKIFKTIDCGANWNETELIDVANFNVIYEIEFVNNLVGYALNAKGILKTNDGGLSWIQLVDDSHPDYNGANILTSFELVDETTAYFGSPYYWGLYKTTDGSQSFSFEERFITDIDFQTGELGYAIDGTPSLNIIKTVDGGLNWVDVFDESNSITLTDIFFVSENKGWVVGWNGIINYTESGAVATGVNEIDLLSKIQIYPNPVKFKLNLKSNLSNGKKIEEISIINIFGENLYTQRIKNTNVIEIDLPDISSGIYFLSISLSTEEILVKKIIVE